MNVATRLRNTVSGTQMVPRRVPEISTKTVAKIKGLPKKNHERYHKSINSHRFSHSNSQNHRSLYF